MQFRKKKLSQTGYALHYTSPNIAIRYNKKDLKSTFILPTRKKIKSTHINCYHLLALELNYWFLFRIKPL